QPVASFSAALFHAGDFHVCEDDPQRCQRVDLIIGRDRYLQSNPSAIFLTELPELARIRPRVELPMTRMSESLSMARMSRILDVLLVTLAVAVRLAAVLVLRSYEVTRSTYEHGEIAANLVAGRGFAMRFLGADGPTSQQAPIYPALVGIAYFI